jgi:hypothetical protein
MKFNIEEAMKFYTKMCAGKLTCEEWGAYCAQLLEALMEDNKEVLENLKNS